MLDEGRDKMLTRLFAVAHDVDARLLLFGERYPKGILFAFDQRLAFEFPGRPEFLRL